MKELRGKKVKVTSINYPCDVFIGKLVHDTELDACVIGEKYNRYSIFRKAAYFIEEYKSPEEIRNEKLLEIVMEYYHDNIDEAVLVNQISGLFKEV